jgi:hypothetical protein
VSKHTTKTVDGVRAREAVGVFQNPEAVEKAVEALEVSGFDRAACPGRQGEGTDRPLLRKALRKLAPPLLAT